MTNPYAPPQAPLGPPMPGGLTEGKCPRCNSQNTRKPSFTWWGGALGPKLFNHTICAGCGLGFNSKTGKSNATAIGIYLGVTSTIALLLVVLYAMK